MTAPVASITIPTFNTSPALLQAAIDSALGQTVPVEVIVIDDGSDVPVPAQDGVRLLRHDQNRGIAAALNTGIEAATAPWICWLSSDDEFAPMKVEAQLEHLLRVGGRAGHHAWLAYDRAALEATGDVSVYHRRDGVWLPTNAMSCTCIWSGPGQQNRMLSRACRINGACSAIHRSVFEDVGLYDTGFKYGQDWELWCRIGKKYRWYTTPCPRPECARRTNIIGLEDMPRRVSDCPICAGFGAAPLTARKEGGNLTAAIAANDVMRRIRDAEDERIRRQYRLRDSDVR